MPGTLPARVTAWPPSELITVYTLPPTAMGCLVFPPRARDTELTCQSTIDPATQTPQVGCASIPVTGNIARNGTKNGSRIVGERADEAVDCLEHGELIEGPTRKSIITHSDVSRLRLAQQTR